MDGDSDGEVDHYVILGLPSGEQGAKLSEEEIKKAFKSKSLKLHPDKRPDDPDANRHFCNLRTSFNILMDKNARQSFHQSMIKRRRKRKSLQQNSNSSSRRRHRNTDVEQREQAARAAHLAAIAAHDLEEHIHTRNQKIIAGIKRHAAAAAATTSEPPPAAAASSTLNEGVAASTQCPCGYCQGDSQGH